MKRAIAAALVLAGCGMSVGDSPPVPPDGGGSGAPPPCTAAVTVTEPVPTAGPGAMLEARAQAVGGVGMVDYAWQVQFNGAPIGFTKSLDGLQIDVPVPDAGIYVVTLTLPGCTPAVVPVNIEAPGARIETVRLQIVPPRGTAAPPLDLLRDVKGGGAADLGAISVLSGRLVQVAVLGPSGGVPAYLQFSPNAMPGAIVEAFSDASGAAAAQLVTGLYSVLVVPSAAGLAPRRFANWSPGVALRVDGGSTITGTVVYTPGPGPGEVALAGATVRVVSDGVPSTPAITVGDGSFALHAAAGPTVTVEVTPPAATGLPRLLGPPQAFTPGTPGQVHYAANLGLVDLVGTVVRRQGAAVAGARLTVVGSLATAGTVTMGTMVVATGQVRAVATAGAAGKLPSTLVPAGVLSAVIEVAPGDLAVAALDTTGGAPNNLDAPPMQVITTAARAGGAGLAGAVLDLVPTAELAMASAPTLRFTAAAGGAIATTLPAGGRYELRFWDPQGRRAPLTLADRPITAIASGYALPAAIQIQGALLRDGTLPMAGASVQLLCNGCSGLDAVLPLATVSSDAAGRFSLAVPDPGTR